MSDQATNNQSVEQFGWAVLGPGNIARRFVSQLPASARGELVAVGSSDPERAAAFATTNGVPDAHVGSYAEVLADPAVDVVYVSTVHTGHARLTLAALAAGKHVLCEKPMAPNRGTVMAMVDAARTSGTSLIEAYMYRFHPQTAKVRELVGEGAIGELTHVDASFAFRTGSTQGRLSDVDLAGARSWTSGGMRSRWPGAWWALLWVVGSPSRPASPPPAHWARPADEWTVAQLGFVGGVTASVRTGVRLQDANTVTIYGSAGTIHLDDPWTLGTDPVLTLTVVGQEPQEIRFGGALPYGLEADAVADSVGVGESPRMSLEDSLGNALVLDQWRAAIGLRYPFEAEDADEPTVSGAPLTVDPQNPMLYGDIAGVGKKISRLVMGVDNQPDLAHASAIFDHFVTQGGNAFDTGYIYGGGVLEGRLGQWIANRGIRKDVVVITKGARTPHCDPASITRQLTESLQRQGTDYADIYMMHRDNPDVPVGEFVDVLDEHFRAGRIHVYGGSNWTPPGSRRPTPTRPRTVVSRSPW